MTDNSLKEALINYLDTYFVKRDLPSTLRMFSQKISGFGTARDEKASSVDDFKLLCARDIQQSPGSLRYIITGLTITHPMPGVGLISCELNTRTEILNQEIILNNLRLSTVWTMHDTWLMEHIHLSLPSVEHEGDESYPLKELEERNRILQRLVNEKTEELNNALKQVRHLATTDKLTQLHNRMKIDELLNQEIKRSTRYKNIFSITLIDIDNFKKLNDKHGHLWGDRVLKTFAQIIKRRTRQTDYLGRWGGEEFIIISPETDSKGAAIAAENLRTSFENNLFDTEARITASFGITQYVSEDTSDTIVARADMALCASKEKGRNTLTIE